MMKCIRYNINSNKKIKTILLICGSLLLTSKVEAQFTTSSGATTTNDNVGIGLGTAVPDAQLSLQSGYSNAGCATYSGKPALKINWTIPDMFCPPPGPSGTRPNILEVFNKYTSGGTTTITPYLMMDYAANLGLGTNPISGYKFSVLGNSILNGNLQVGNLSLPSGTRMVVDGDVAITNSSSSTWRNLTARTTNAAFNIAANTGSDDGGTIELYGPSYSGHEGQVKLISYGNTGTGVEFISYNPTLSTWVSNMKVMNTGQVTIGTRQPIGSYSGYKLGVDGDIVCTRAVVQAGSWADFVFKPDYDLPTLTSVEEYITKNKHLPNVPSEQTILKNGVDVGDMNKILLQKVEELTLYMIQLQKQNENLQAQIDLLKK
jgi:hypothetical protein